MRKHQKCFWVYILASLSGTLYVGVTDDIRKRLIEHKLGVVDGFTKKYKVNRLMYFEVCHDGKAAGSREKQLKKFRREKKIALFAKSNPQWTDLSDQFSGTSKDLLM